MARPVNDERNVGVAVFPVISPCARTKQQCLLVPDVIGYSVKKHSDSTGCFWIHHHYDTGREPKRGRQEADA